MGEIADMMINGDLCEQCGQCMDGPGDGFPRSCSECRDNRCEDKQNRFKYALEKIREAGFQPVVKSNDNFHIKVGDWSFWAWTGSIYKDGGKKIEERGLRNFLKLLKQ